MIKTSRPGEEGEDGLGGDCFEALDDWGGVVIGGAEEIDLIGGAGGGADGDGMGGADGANDGDDMSDGIDGGTDGIDGGDDMSDGIDGGTDGD